MDQGIKGTIRRIVWNELMFYLNMNVMLVIEIPINLPAFVNLLQDQFVRISVKAFYEDGNYELSSD